MLKRYFGSRDDVPEWARFFDKSGYRAFLEAVGADLTRRGLAHRIEDGVVEIEGVSERCGLLNLAQGCNQSPPEEWTALVARHFDCLLGGDAARAESVRADFEKAKPLLKVRLYPADTLAEDVRLVHREAFPGVIAALVLDLPETIQSLTPEHVARWGRPAEELFALGIQNVRAEGRPQPEQFGSPEEGLMTALLGDSFFTATHALFLEEIVEAGPFGALVAVPHRHAVIAHRIADVSVASALKTLVTMAFGMFQEGPGSISPTVYWWRPGRFVAIPAEVKAKSVTITPPEEFVTEVLNRLGRE